MARRQTANLRRPAKSTRLNKWFFISVPVTTIAANALSLVASLNAEGLDDVPFTIVRTRGIFTIWSDQTAAAEAPRGIMSMIVVQNTAILIGSSAIPDPLNEPDADFFVYQPLQVQPLGQVGDGSTFAEVSQTQYTIDSKAMRKVDTQQDVAIMVRNSSATFGMNIAFQGRFLVKLH